MVTWDETGAEGRWTAVDRALCEKVLDRFVERVRAVYEEDLSRVILFGSVARGEADPSDIDVCVLLDRGRSPTGDDAGDIVDISYEVDREEGAFKTYLSPFVRLVGDYERGLRDGVPVYRAIQEEGRVLYGATT